MGLIFAHKLDAVLSGRKTQTRRVVKTNDTCLNSTYVYRNGRLLWRVGGVYSVLPGRGKRGIAKIRVTAIRQELVSDISEASAVAEGFASAREFIMLWHGMYGRSTENSLAWVLTFELV